VNTAIGESDEVPAAISLLDAAVKKALRQRHRATAWGRRVTSKPTAGQLESDSDEGHVIPLGGAATMLIAGYRSGHAGRWW
jgi:hypothetical protein